MEEGNFKPLPTIWRLGERCKLPSGVRDRGPREVGFGAFLGLQKSPTFAHNFSDFALELGITFVGQVWVK